MKLPPSRRCLPPVQRLLLLKVCNQAPAFRSPLSRLSRSLPPMPVPPADFTPPCGCPSGGCAVNTVRRFRPRFAVALRLTEGTGSPPLHLPFRSFRPDHSATFPWNLPPCPFRRCFLPSVPSKVHGSSRTASVGASVGASVAQFPGRIRQSGAFSAERC